MDWNSYLFSFRGRVNRAKWWLMALLSVVGLFLGALLGYMVGGVVGTLVGYGIASLLVLWSALAVGVKRLHDRDKSGWWLLVFYLVPGILNQLAGFFDSPTAALPVFIVSLGISIWAFVELGCLRGTLGPNQFGDDPLTTPDLAASHF